MSSPAHALDAATERRIGESLERRRRALDRRERLGAILSIALFAVAAIGFAVLATPARELSPSGQTYTRSGRTCT